MGGIEREGSEGGGGGRRRSATSLDAFSSLKPDRKANSLAGMMKVKVVVYGKKEESEKSLSSGWYNRYPPPSPMRSSLPLLPIQKWTACCLGLFDHALEFPYLSLLLSPVFLWKKGETKEGKSSKQSLHGCRSRHLRTRAKPT